MLHGAYVLLFENYTRILLTMITHPPQNIPVYTLRETNVCANMRHMHDRFPTTHHNCKLWYCFAYFESYCILLTFPLQWRHNGHDSVSNHQHHDCLFNRLFRRGSKKTSKFRVTGLCAGNSPGAGEFPAQMASTAENVSIWWRHHAVTYQQKQTICFGLSWWWHSTSHFRRIYLLFYHCS